MFDLILQATLILLCGAAGGAGMAASIFAVFGRPDCVPHGKVNHDANQRKADEDWKAKPIDEAARLSA